MHVMQWRRLPLSLKELCLDTTLRCGQSFRWRKSDDDIWSCALHGRILSLRQDSDYLHYRAIFPQALPSGTSVKLCNEDDDTEQLIYHYLNLSSNLTNLYSQWSAADKNFELKAPKFTGVRILRQDAWEALIGFICSSNNNIIRISQMMENLCVHYGPLIGHYDSKSYYDVPSPVALSGPGVEAHLRQLGFGYRAKYLYQTAVMLNQERGLDWLNKLRNPESPMMGQKPAFAGEMLPAGRQGYCTAHRELLALQGVGPKVADCVCLMGLGWGEAVPVDTHVWQIAQRDYKFGKGKHRSLTKATYDAVGDHFRSLWGKEAGWAHSVLFAADLKAFSTKIIAKVEETLEVKEEVLETVSIENEVGPIRRLKRRYEVDQTSIKFENISSPDKSKRKRKR